MLFCTFLFPFNEETRKEVFKKIFFVLKKSQPLYFHVQEKLKCC